MLVNHFVTEKIKKAINNFLVIIVPYGWHIIFFAIPLLIIFKISFSESIIGIPPYTDIIEQAHDNILKIKINFNNYLWLIRDSLYYEAYLNSLSLASIATIGSLIIGYPIAYGISLISGTWRTVLLTLIILPFWSSFLIRVYSWISLLSDHGLINNFLLFMNIIDEPIAIIHNNIGISIGLIYSYLAFMVLPLYSSLQNINYNYTEVAYDLGCRPYKVFLKIVIPLSYRGIISGSMLVFIPAVGEFVIPTLLGNSESLMIGKVLWDEFFMQQDWATASSLVIILFMVLIIPLMILQKVVSPKIKGVGT